MISIDDRIALWPVTALLNGIIVECSVKEKRREIWWSIRFKSAYKPKTMDNV